MTQVKIAELVNSEKIKFNEEKEKRFNKEIEKCKTKQEAELAALQNKTMATYGEFKRDRAIEFEKLLMRYKNRLRDIERAAKSDINNFSKILKGVASNNII